MIGIDLDKEIVYRHSSLRVFSKGEHHVSRVFPEDVLLLVFDGVLRFCEDGVDYEVHAGEYHIQKHGSVQTGERVSDSPKYLYVHFLAEWKEDGNIIPKRGNFDYNAIKYMIEELDALAHSSSAHMVQSAKFFNILLKLYHTGPANSTAHKIANLLSEEFHREITLDELKDKFHFSKNHIINLFKKEFGMTPIAYTNHVRLKKAEYLMEVTSDTLERVARACGFDNYSYFYKQFVKKNGISPEKWRENIRIGK